MAFHGSNSGDSFGIRPSTQMFEYHGFGFELPHGKDVHHTNQISANTPVILVDAGAIRHNALGYVHELIQQSGFPTFATPMGKREADETLPTFGSVYAGSGSNEGVAARVESADLILSTGLLKSDFNTTGFYTEPAD
ncbi:putative pyruvate decarboxylase [Aspergillus bombycis]|uniref:Putative pyruvate decarboxylase n=1 Tax=Aspergillus bombycis TaxID=109264 RepID=A0A1F7ZSS9_9EURO|nr:putative pyruvate decarboxylase [Aspergillus bombycis]OGM42494.1 putative pyruvate decarboxylase [Aspergillus bombycis]